MEETNKDINTKVALVLEDEKYAKMHEMSRRVYSTDYIAPTIHTSGGGNQEPKILCSRRTAKGKQLRREGIERFADRELQPKVDGTSNAITTVQKDNMVMEQISINTDKDGLATTLTTAHHYSGNIINPKRGQKQMGVLEQTPINTDAIRQQFRIRKLTERECFRLMGVDDSDIDTIQASKVSRSQQYKLAGNSIVVHVLAAIFDKMFLHTQSDDAQLKLF